MFNPADYRSLIQSALKQAIKDNSLALGIAYIVLRTDRHDPYHEIVAEFEKQWNEYQEQNAEQTEP